MLRCHRVYDKYLIKSIFSGWLQQYICHSMWSNWVLRENPTVHDLTHLVKPFTKLQYGLCNSDAVGYMKKAKNPKTKIVDPVEVMWTTSGQMYRHQIKYLVKNPSCVWSLANMAHEAAVPNTAVLLSSVICDFYGWRLVVLLPIGSQSSHDALSCIPPRICAFQINMLETDLLSILRHSGRNMQGIYDRSTPLGRG